MNNPAFVDNATYFSLDSGLTELEQATSLAENLKKIHVLTTTHFSEFDVLIHEYLQTGLDIFQMEIGIVSRIEGDAYHICDAISPGNTLSAGDIFPLKDTYCHEVCKSDEVIGFPHVGALEKMKSHPVYQNMRLESYISAPIYKENRLFGTLNFTSTQIRKNGFSEHERDLISLMANAIGSFLELKDKENDLIKSNTRLKELVGYVAHDIRGPMGNVVAFAGMLEFLDDEEKDRMIREIAKSSDKALSMIYNILELAAMGTGKIQLNREAVDLAIEVQSAIEQMTLFARSNQVDFISHLESVTCEIDAERMSQVLTNLLTNAIKYTPSSQAVTVKVEALESGEARVSIENALDPSQSHEDVKAFSISDSVGFGLEIVREVLSLHDSSLRIHKTGDTFRAEFLLTTCASTD